jgi:hypothetical protein
MINVFKAVVTPAKTSMANVVRIPDTGFRESHVSEAPATSLVGNQASR